MRSKGFNLAKIVVRRLIGAQGQKLMLERLARMSPVWRYVVIGLWLYRRLKRQSQGEITQLRVKPGEVLQVAATKSK